MAGLEQFRSPYRHFQYEPRETTGGLDSLLLSSLGGGGGGGGRGGGGGGGGSAPSSGSVNELFFDDPRGFNASASVDPSHGDHLHFASESVNMRPLGRNLERKGFDVGGLSGFQGQGPISSGHVDNSYHYRTGKKGAGQAMDVTYNGGGRWGNETRALSWLERWLMKRYG